MGDGSLSQDEIDALLRGTDDIDSMMGGGGFSQPPSMGVPTFGGPASVSGADIGALREGFASFAGSVAPSLSGYLGGKNLIISNPVVEIKSRDALVRDLNQKYVQVSLDYSGQLNGKNVIIYNFQDAGIVSSLMMGNESGAPLSDLTDAHQSTIQEFTNQFLSSIATQLGMKTGGAVNTSPAIVSIINNSGSFVLPQGDMVLITYDFVIQGILTSKLYHVLDMNLASSLARILGGGGGPQQAQAQQQSYAQQPQQTISPVKFPPLDERVYQTPAGDISILLDVPMTLTVELGRTSKLVQEILGLGEGSIIELDKLAGEPVDILVNGKLIAKGEVVVIDENFGVRITDIVSPDQRLMSFGSEH